MSREAYFQAIRAGDVTQLRQLVQETPELLELRGNPDYAPEKETRSTGLHIAIYADQLESAKVLLDAGIDIEAVTTEGRTALHDSIEFGRVPVTELLLERGAVIDICSAAILGRLDRLRELLDADPAAVNDRSTFLSPLGWASFGNQVATATELIDRGARMDDGELCCAAQVGHVEVGELLVQRGADVNEVNPQLGGTPLHAAVTMRYTHNASRFVKMLLRHGADVNARAVNGMTPLDLVERNAKRQDLEKNGHPKPYHELAALIRASGARNSTAI